VLYDKETLVLLVAILVLYVSFALLIKYFLWDSGIYNSDLKKLVLLRSVFIGIWFTPSVFLSSHAAIPLPALLALFAGVIFPSPSFSASFALLVFTLASIIGFSVCRVFYKRKIARAENVI
jgi:hypothetical protein